MRCSQLEDVYAEIYRVLKPGALFASYEWVATAKFDAGNPDHVRIMDDINYGNGLPVRERCLMTRFAAGTALPLTLALWFYDALPKPGCDLKEPMFLLNQPRSPVSTRP